MYSNIPKDRTLLDFSGRPGKKDICPQKSPHMLSLSSRQSESFYHVVVRMCTTLLHLDDVFYMYRTVEFR